MRRYARHWLEPQQLSHQSPVLPEDTKQNSKNPSEIQAKFATPGRPVHYRFQRRNHQKSYNKPQPTR